MLDLIGAYENYLTKVKQASANTIASYLRDIRQFAGWLKQVGNADVVDATQLNISDYLSHLEQDGRSGATVSRSLASLKNFFSYVVSSGFLEKSPVMDLHVDRGEKKLPQILTGGDQTFRQLPALAPKSFRQLFKTVVKTGFNQRRKTLRNSLKPLIRSKADREGWSEEQLAEFVSDPVFELRPERLSVEDFIALTLKLS